MSERVLKPELINLDCPSILINGGQNYLMESDEANDAQALFTNKPEQYGSLIKEYRKE